MQNAIRLRRVGLVERYGTKSGDAAHLRKLAALQPERHPDRRPLPKKARRLSDKELVRFTARYVGGATVMVLAEEFGIHRTTVMHLTAKLDIRRLPRVLSAEDLRRAIERYRSGATLAAVAREFGVANETMRTYLLAAGEEIRRRGRPSRSL